LGLFGGSKKTYQASNTSVDTANQYLDDVDGNAQVVKGSNNTVTTTDLGAVAAGADVARDSMEHAADVTMEALATVRDLDGSAQAFAERAGREAMQTVASIARDPQSLAMEQLIKYGSLLAVAGLIAWTVKGMK